MRTEHTDAWYSKSWRPVAAFVYLTICFIDFSLMPIYCEWLNHSRPLAQMVDLSLKFSDPIIAFKMIHAAQVWTPLTLAFNGLFHAAFGAILGVSAWQRGNEKIARIKADGQSTDTTIDNISKPTE